MCTAATYNLLVRHIFRDLWSLISSYSKRQGFTSRWYHSTVTWVSHCVSGCSLLHMLNFAFHRHDRHREMETPCSSHELCVPSNPVGVSGLSTSAILHAITLFCSAACMGLVLQPEGWQLFICAWFSSCISACGLTCCEGCFLRPVREKGGQSPGWACLLITKGSTGSLVETGTPHLERWGGPPQQGWDLCRCQSQSEDRGQVTELRRLMVLKSV